MPLEGAFVRKKKERKIRFKPVFTSGFLILRSILFQKPSYDKEKDDLLLDAVEDS